MPHTKTSPRPVSRMIVETMHAPHEYKIIFEQLVKLVCEKLYPGLTREAVNLPEFSFLRNSLAKRFVILRIEKCLTVDNQ
jgi:hypothetical protein